MTNEELFEWRCAEIEKLVGEDALTIWKIKMFARIVPDEPWSDEDVKTLGEHAAAEAGKKLEALQQQEKQSVNKTT